MKMEAVAAELGVATSTWGHWEEGRRFPTLENLALLARYTGIPIQHFLCPHKSRCPFSKASPLSRN
jgi:transcriptional regulator with XRE-family HTH domain